MQRNSSSVTCRSANSWEKCFICTHCSYILEISILCLKQSEDREREREREREIGRKTRKREEVGGEERRGDRLMRRNMNKLIRLIHKVRCGTGLKWHNMSNEVE